MSPMTEYGVIGCLFWGFVLGAIITGLIARLIVFYKKLNQPPTVRAFKLDESEFYSVLDSTKEARKIKAFKAEVDKIDRWFVLDKYNNE